MKDYLSYENARNKQHAALYERLMRIALKSEGTVSILIGHHLCFEIDGKLETENEIPSADCLMFDHDIMFAAFGEDKAIQIMRDLATVESGMRDNLLAAYVSVLERKE